MKLSPTGSIELNDRDVVRFREYMNTNSDSRRKFNRQDIRGAIDENNTKIYIVDHHIAPHQLIREQLISLCSSTPDNTELKKIIESYLNDARNEPLRKIVSFEITTKASHGGQIIFMSFTCNPNNLVFGPDRDHRSNDPNGGIDEELLAHADSAKLEQLKNRDFCLTEKLLMIGDVQQRGTSTWTRDPKNKTKFVHTEDRERMGQQVCQWYKEGFDTTENPIWQIHLPTGTLVPM